MPFMKWDDTFSVNVKEIDLQHQKLMGMINEFYDHLRGNAKQALNDLLASMVDYTKYHFSTEEKYFDAFAYPKGAHHKNIHEQFKAKVMDVRNRLAKGELVISMEVTNFLKDWLVEHIKGSDKKYSRWFNDHGLY